MERVVEGTTETVQAVKFSFMTPEEVTKLSLVKLQNPLFLDTLDNPVPGGLYDPAMGPLRDDSRCKSCGQLYRFCPGHFGHIDLFSTVYNPLLFRLLHNILRRMCFFCYKFKAVEAEVKQCVTQLELISKGDVVEAKRFEMPPQTTLCSNPEVSEGSYESHSVVSMDDEFGRLENPGKQQWSSLQLTEAMSILNRFLKKNTTKCPKCKRRNSKVTVPTFGWFHLSDNAAYLRQNIIRGIEPRESFPDGVQESTSSKVGDADDAFPGELDETYSNGDSVQKVRERERRLVTDRILKLKETFSSELLPTEVRGILRLLWENESQICSYINNIQGELSSKCNNSQGYCMFFLDTLLVPPIKFRPPAKSGESIMEHPQTMSLSKVLQSNISLENAHHNKSDKMIITQWINLQQSINVLFDSKTFGQGKKESSPGICQILEKKEGLFRQKMMGKRVNYACRSVISPDPYLAVNEIGIPPHFATRLTYPERVTPWNVDKLRRAIINGPSVHPGATHFVENSKLVRLERMSKKSRIALSRKLPSFRGSDKISGNDYEGKCVFRHLQDGDVVLVNRQPTLHKPSIMGHVVRVLKGEKTIRMHYANCSSYNADFDGDEMNVHFPQDEISRAEGYSIVNANNQYIVPTRGETVRGLIQDHITSAVLLTKRDTFLNRDLYNQLLYSCGVSASSSQPSPSKPGRKLCILSFEDEMQIDLPAILKPKRLWTGKQVISTVLNHITKGRPAFTVEKEGKIPKDYFASNSYKIGQEVEKSFGKGSKGEENKIGEDHKEKKRYLLGEETLYIFKNYLVCGVIDKAQFGNYGLVHTVQELYGSSVAGNLLSVLSRLFTAFLQIYGFTCGVDDLLILEQRNLNMKEILKEECKSNGEEVHCEFLQSKLEDMGPVKLQMEIERAIRSNGESAITSLDGMMRTRLSDLVNTINKELFPKGLLKPFPKNCFSLMTTTGAKGGAANFQQVSSLLGQQDLEGKRVPRMSSGKTLPCFLPWDCTSRAGGFISDNFLNGLRPQEYYFHCMAGREGLVDTAVKTSRSGYLQRCLIKNLEGLKVCYDHTVRDSDGSIIQFSYGEDGVDVHHNSFLLKFEALDKNREILEKKFDPQRANSNGYIKKLPELIHDEAAKFSGKSLPLDNRKLGSTKNSRAMDTFMKLITHKYFSSLAQPGEPVGVIAAQSVGEPSTQMTLNTFHLAGRGEMNVTLGIPRLQEILMTASSNINTPMMTCPLQKGRSMDDAKRLAGKLKKVTLADVVESMEVCVVPISIENDEISSIYKLKIKLYRPDIYPPHVDISTKDCRQSLKGAFLKQLEIAVQKHIDLLFKISGIKNFTLQSGSQSMDDNDKDGVKTRKKENDDDDGDDADDGEVADDLGFDAQKRKEQATDEVDYEDGSDGEPSDELSDETEKENDQDDHNKSEASRKDVNKVITEYGRPGETSQDSETGVYDSDGETSDSKETGSVGKGENLQEEEPEGKISRIIFSSVKGLHFEVHIKLRNDDPHILLAQIAETTAKKVYIKNSGDIDECQAVTCAERQVIYHGDDPKVKKNISSDEKKSIPALHAAGLDFKAFWGMEDDLDIRYLYSNSVHAMLETYGVEAARATIIMEIQNVFGLYGIKVDYRHLSVIADYMTFTGSYRPLSRIGRIAESTSPFSKMSFETASKFIVEAACHSQSDYLENPSARICLGLPVKLGTGSFDLLENIGV